MPPWQMIAFVDDTFERDTGLLESANMIAEVHQNYRVGGQLLKHVGNLGLESDTGAGVNPGLAETDRLLAPGDCITGCNQRKHDEGDDDFAQRVAGKSR